MQVCQPGHGRSIYGNGDQACCGGKHQFMSLSLSLSPFLSHQLTIGTYFGFSDRKSFSDEISWSPAPLSIPVGGIVGGKGGKKSRSVGQIPVDSGSIAWMRGESRHTIGTRTVCRQRRYNYEMQGPGAISRYQPTLSTDAGG